MEAEVVHKAETCSPAKDADISSGGHTAPLLNIPDHLHAALTILRPKRVHEALLLKQDVQSLLGSKDSPPEPVVHHLIDQEMQGLCNCSRCDSVA